MGNRSEIESKPSELKRPVRAASERVESAKRSMVQASLRSALNWQGSSRVGLRWSALGDWVV